MKEDDVMFVTWNSDYFTVREQFNNTYKMTVLFKLI